MTASACLPQPVQVVFPQRVQRAGLHILVLLMVGSDVRTIPPWVLGGARAARASLLRTPAFESSWRIMFARRGALAA